MCWVRCCGSSVDGARARDQTRLVTRSIFPSLALLLAACSGSPPATTTRDSEPTTDAKTTPAVKAADDGVDPATAKKLAEGAKALAIVSADQRSLLAGAALAEAEGTRLPAELVTAFGEMQRVPPEMRALVAMKAIASPAMLKPLAELCEGRGAEWLAQVAQLAPDDKPSLVWESCGLERVGLVTLAQAQQAGIGPLLLAHVAHRVMVGKGGASADEMALLRAFVID